MRGGAVRKQTRGFSNTHRLIDVCRLLNHAGAKYIVIGAWAANFHGLNRATRDIDVLIPKDVTNTQRVLDALGHLTFGLARELDAAEITKKPFTIIGDTPRVDLLTVAHNVKYEEAIRTANVAQLQGVKIPFVAYPVLVRTKATDRLQDKADLERLERIVSARGNRRKK